METSIRLEKAIQKLYIAFNNNSLHPECCKQCAVGNILDKTDSWKNLSDDHGSFQLNYVGKVHQSFGRTFNGYSPFELLKIEVAFLKACGYELPFHHKNKKPKTPLDKDVLFNGISAVIAILCELDGVENIMNYTKLFEFKKEKNHLIKADLLT